MHTTHTTQTRTHTHTHNEREPNIYHQQYRIERRQSNKQSRPNKKWKGLQCEVHTVTVSFFFANFLHNDSPTCTFLRLLANHHNIDRVYLRIVVFLCPVCCFSSFLIIISTVLLHSAHKEEFSQKNHNHQLPITISRPQHPHPHPHIIHHNPRRVYPTIIERAMLSSSPLLSRFKLTSAVPVSSARATKMAGRWIVVAARIRTTATTATCNLANRNGRLQSVQRRRQPHQQQRQQQQFQQQSSLAAVYAVPASIETTAGTAAAVGKRITVPRTTATRTTTKAKPITSNERASIATAVTSAVYRRNKLQRCHDNNNNDTLSWDQARSLFLSAFVPMVGFGFMDQFIMVSAGSYIDNTLGVQLGLATMSAAACGQVISDSCGVLMGGTLERLLLIAPAKLSTSQQTLPQVRRIKLLGGVLGVITGCVIGAIPLILSSSREEEEEHHHSQQQNERYEKQQRIGSFLNNVMTSPGERWSHHSARCTLHIQQDDEKQVWPVSSSTSCATTSNGAATVVNVSSVRRGEYSDSTTTNPVQQCMDSSPDGSIIIYGHKIYVPVVRNNNNNQHQVVAVLQIESSSSNGQDFGTPADIDDAKQLARHIGYQL